MSTLIRKTDPFIAVMCAAFNALKQEVLAATTTYHMDATEKVVTAADATDLASSIVLANDLRAVWVAHKADTLALKTVDTATLTAPVMTTLATGYTLANEIKGDYATHIASTAWHYAADSTNTIAASDATTQESLNTLLNELKADLNLHMADAPTTRSFRVVDA